MQSVPSLTRFKNNEEAQLPKQGMSTLAGKADFGNIIGHGFYKTKRGRRRRYRCGICGKTFCCNSGTPYHRLQPLSNG